MSTKQEQILRIDPPVELTFTGKSNSLLYYEDLLNHLNMERAPHSDVYPYYKSFSGPFHQAVSSVMTLTNPSDRKVCFKIKTTAPKRYCVKPNSGVIDPKQTVQIAGW